MRLEYRQVSGRCTCLKLLWRNFSYGGAGRCISADANSADRATCWRHMLIKTAHFLRHCCTRHTVWTPSENVDPWTQQMALALLCLASAICLRMWPRSGTGDVSCLVSCMKASVLYISSKQGLLHTKEAFWQQLFSKRQYWTNRHKDDSFHAIVTIPILTSYSIVSEWFYEKPRWLID